MFGLFTFTNLCGYSQGQRKCISSDNRTFQVLENDDNLSLVFSEESSNDSYSSCEGYDFDFSISSRSRASDEKGPQYLQS